MVSEPLIVKALIILSEKLIVMFGYSKKLGLYPSRCLIIGSQQMGMK
jgi:hypothetical protein